MLNALIIAAGLVAGPIVGYSGWRAARSRPNLDRRLVAGALVFCVLSLAGYVSGVQFVLSPLNFLCFSLAYTASFFVYWHLLGANARPFRWLVGVAGGGALALGVLLSTIGLLGLGLVAGEIEPDSRQPLGSGLTAQTYGLGNAVADYRGLRVAVFKPLPLLPVLQRPVADTSYYSFVPYVSEPTLRYRPEAGGLVVRAELDSLVFADTIAVR